MVAQLCSCWAPQKGGDGVAVGAGSCVAQCRVVGGGNVLEW